MQTSTAMQVLHYNHITIVVLALYIAIATQVYIAYACMYLAYIASYSACYIHNYIANVLQIYAYVYMETMHGFF